MKTKQILDYVENKAIRFGLITYTVDIQDNGGNGKGIVYNIPVHYTDSTHDIPDNTIDISNPEKPIYHRLNPSAKFLENPRNEKLYDPWQLQYFALITPSACNTIEKVRSYWGLKLDLSYRQARNIWSCMKDFDANRKFALEYFLSLFPQAR